MDLLLLWLFATFFNTPCWSEVTLVAVWFFFYPNRCKAVEIPMACTSFPSCFCGILISFGCVNLTGPLNQHHPVCIVSAHLVALGESTLSVNRSAVWLLQTDCSCILSLPYSLPALFSPLWVEPIALCTAFSPCLNVLLASLPSQLSVVPR